MLRNTEQALQEVNTNVQFTLTCKDEVGLIELRHRLYKFLHPLTMKNLREFEVAIEISPKLRYHAHGYVTNLFNFKEVNQVRMRLFAWKKKYGFVQISTGDLDSWRKYIRKSPIQIITYCTLHSCKPTSQPAISLDQFCLNKLPSPQTTPTNQSTHQTNNDNDDPGVD